MQVSHQPRIYVAGHRGMVGAAIVRALQAKGYTNLVTRPRAELDLTNQTAVRAFFQSERIDQVYLAAAKVGGIHHWCSSTRFSSSRVWTLRCDRDECLGNAEQVAFAVISAQGGIHFAFENVP